MVQLYHVSPSHNDQSIRVRGILRLYSRIAHQRIYVVERNMVEWAIEHVQARHSTDRVTVWIVRIDKRLCRQCFHHYWYTERDIAPQQILGQLAVTADRKVHL